MATLWQAFSSAWESRLKANLSREKNDKHCLMCGNRATIYEEVQEDHVFCHEECQRDMWTLNHALVLRMESRGSTTALRVPNFASNPELSEVVHTILSCRAAPSRPPLVFNLNERIAGLNQKRHILFTDARLQFAIQKLEPGESVEMEMHPTQNQFLRVEEGSAAIVVGRDERTRVTLQSNGDDVAILIAGTWHKIVNSDPVETLKFYTLYAPPAHTAQEQAADDHEAGQ